jgi:hypothetical protein
VKIIVAVLLLAANADADELHATLAAGGSLRLDAPALGGWAAAELWPAGLWGVRVDLHRIDGDLLVEGSVSRALGATWRHLVIAAHLGGGVDHDRAAVAGGLTTELGLGVGPLVLATDLTLHAVAGGDAIVTLALGLGVTF